MDAATFDAHTNLGALNAHGDIAVLGQGSFWAEMASNDIVRQSMLAGLAALVALVVCVRAMLRLRKTNAAASATLRAMQVNGYRKRGPISDQTGVATFEFCLVLPIFMFVSLLLAQLTMVMAGNLFVHHAAFVATRAAIVQVPQPTGAGRNVIVNSQGDEKLEAVRKAALLALVPVSGREESGGSGGAAYNSALLGLYDGYQKNTPNWLTPTQGVGKWRSYSISTVEAAVYYADRNTNVHWMEIDEMDADDVVFKRIPQGESRLVGPKDPVTVQVEHRLHLGVPYVRWIFSDTEVQVREYETMWGERTQGYDYDKQADNRKYRTVTAQYTLHNEGVDDQLPPEPSIPRVP